MKKLTITVTNLVITAIKLAELGFFYSPTPKPQLFYTFNRLFALKPKAPI